MGEIDLSGVQGAVRRPGDEGFAELSQAHQRAVVQRPIAVVEAASVEDVRAVLAAADAAGVTVAPQAGGHGASEDLAGSVLLRLGAFDRIEVDHEAGVAVVGAGVSAGDLLERLAGTGLVPPVGTSPDVSVVPLLLGGGHGWTARATGLSSQSLRRVELVRPDGEQTWVGDESDPELMAVLRGAGGLVGIVTAVEIDLVRASTLLGGAARFPLADAAAVWGAARDADLPESATVFVASMRMPDAPFLPEAVRGRSWFAVQSLALDGERAAIEAIHAVGSPLSAELGPIDVAAIPGITQDPREGAAAATVSALIGELPDEAIAAILAWHASDRGAAAVSVGARRLGGALDRAGRPSIAAVRGAGWLVNAILPIAPGADAQPVEAAGAAFLEAIREWTVPGNVPTFLGAGQRLAEAVGDEGVALVLAQRERLDATVIRPTRL